MNARTTPVAIMMAHLLVRHLLASISAEKALDKEMSHQEADKDTTVAAILLLRAVIKVDESQRSSENVGKLACSDIGFGVVGAAKRVIVKGHTIEGRDKKQ
ncbi:hypothetical protein HG531_003644 [Fusarium graminearum]|nr:hypothetical protein HG531_003644 [Fusarium graminearum]